MLDRTHQRVGVQCRGIEAELLSLEQLVFRCHLSQVLVHLYHGEAEVVLEELLEGMHVVGSDDHDDAVFSKCSAPEDVPVDEQITAIPVADEVAA